MNYLSVCSGIEAATVAWHHMGWKPVGFSEIEKFPSQVLAHHYPQVTNFGDMTKYKEWQIDGTVGLLVGGTPCQSFSIAGLRKGLSDPRGNLALTYVGILDHFRPKWFIWENVQGVLSSGQGRDFAAFLTALGIIGYGWSYRVLDAQYFGVAQRRRRVFVVGHLGSWKPAAEILFESDCLSGNTKKGRKKGQESATDSQTSFRTSGNGNISQIAYEWHNQDSRIKPVQIAATLNCNAGGKEGHLVQKVYENHPSDSRVREMGDVCQTVTSSWGTGGGNIPFVQNIYSMQGNLIGRDIGGPNGLGVSENEPMYTLTKTDVHAVAFTTEQTPKYNVEQALTLTQSEHKHNQCVMSWDAELNPHENKSGTLIRGGQGGRTDGVLHNTAVRRLTPIECERLQGFPDGYTDIKPNNKETPDGHRYKALGNSMAVPVMRWIGERINNYERV